MLYFSRLTKKILLWLSLSDVVPGRVIFNLNSRSLSGQNLYNSTKETFKESSVQISVTVCTFCMWKNWSRIMTKSTKWVCAQRRFRSDWAWSESSLTAWRNLEPLATLWAHSEDSDQAGRMPRLIWVFAGRTVTLLVLSCRDSLDTDLICFQLRAASKIFRIKLCLVESNINATIWN